MKPKEFGRPGGGNPASYWETGIPSKLSKWALEGPKAGQFQEEGSQVSALPFGWDVVLARTWLGCVSKLRKT